MNSLILEGALKFFGSLLVGASLMFWLGRTPDLAQIAVFAIGLTVILIRLEKK